MTMYHMAMPPHFGALHPPAMHSSLFPGPLLPPGSHTQPMHSFPGGGQTNVEMPQATSMRMHVASTTTPLYQHQPQQPSVYINPYLSHAHHHHYQQHMQPHTGSHIHSSGSEQTSMAHHNQMAILPAPCQLNRHTTSEHQYYLNRRQPLSVDEELFEEMTTLHLGYMETEDSPHKMEQREKLESVINEYLSITPHSHKFTFHQVLEVLEQSINTKSNFSAHDAAHGFDALAQYAANLISQPWRREFKELKLHNGFWIHQVSSFLSGAESILELMGYVCMSGKTRSLPTTDSRALGGRICQEYYVMQGVLDPDLISRLALDCMIAYCECQCLKKIYEGVSEYGLSWSQILQFRQHYIGGVDVTLRHLIFTLRQRVTPVNFSIATPEISLPGGPPPIPVRQGPGYTGTTASTYISHSSKPTTPSAGDHSPMNSELMTGKLSLCSTPVEELTNNTMKEASYDMPDNKNADALLNSHSSSSAPALPIKKNSSNRLVDHVDGSSRAGGNGQKYSSRVPTAKLIDLDSMSHESFNHSSGKASSGSHYLPKVLPHKSNVRNSSRHPRNSLPTESETPPPPPHLPAEAFQAGTLEEHLEATLNLVKNPCRNPTTTTSSNNAVNSKTPDRSSWETWDFVYRGLEKKGYSKDTGDRGDILYEISRQKNCSSDGLSSSSRTVGNPNINLNNRRKEPSTKNRPLTINQALQQFTLNETKECIDRPTSGRNSYIQENTKRSSLYDNVSGGFETALQGSDDSDDRKHQQVLRKINNSTRAEINNSDSFRNCNSFNSSAGSVSNKGNLGTSDSGKMTKPINNEKNNNWPCATCTYLNEGEKNVCEMCGKSKDPRPDADKPLASGGKQCSRCTLINDKDLENCSACGTGLKGSSTYI